MLKIRRKQLKGKGLRIKMQRVTLNCLGAGGLAATEEEEECDCVGMQLVLD
ncbi:hypothetical protein Csa_024012, partial [Cucumis sativus]